MTAQDTISALHPIHLWLVPEIFNWYAAHNSEDTLGQLDDAIHKVVQSRPPASDSALNH